MVSKITKSAFEHKIVEFSKNNGRTKEFVERIVANVIVAQVLTDADPGALANNFIKGGTGVALRTGWIKARATSDLDMAMGYEQSQINELVNSIEGLTWGCFIVGKIKARPDKTQTKVAEEYRLREFNVPLLYGDSQWRTVRLEISRHEVDLPNLEISEHLDSEFEDFILSLGLPALGPIRLIPVELQIAQKIHAMSGVDSERGHDVFDVWALLNQVEVDLEKLARVVAKTYKFRNAHNWSPTFTPSQKFRIVYETEVEPLQFAPPFEKAMETVLNLMAQVDDRMS